MADFRKVMDAYHKWQALVDRADLDDENISAEIFEASEALRREIAEINYAVGEKIINRLVNQENQDEGRQ